MHIFVNMRRESYQCVYDDDGEDDDDYDDDNDCDDNDPPPRLSRGRVWACYRLYLSVTLIM